jgi:AcrR family transcriptional regulator
MCARPYNRHRRDVAMLDTRRRIIEAVVALHAERGAARTSYALIAQRADVAVPTVYKHFPDLTALFEGCVGHVASRAPPLDIGPLASLPDTPARLAALVHMLFRRHRFLAPWLRLGLHEAQIIPELRPHMTAMAAHQQAAISAALAPSFGAAPPPVLVALVDTLLGFASWERLTDDGLGDDDAADAVIDAARAVVASFVQPASSSPHLAAGRATP